jgi:hypothetical protein
MFTMEMSVKAMVLVGVVKLFTEFTTGYWWGSWLLVGVVLLDLSFFCALFSDSDYPFGIIWPLYALIQGQESNTQLQRPQYNG